MGLEVTPLLREFRCGATVFPDLGPEYTPEKVKAFYEDTHGFLTNYVIDGPTFEDGKMVYEFLKEVGDKG